MMHIFRTDTDTAYTDVQKPAGLLTGSMAAEGGERCLDVGTQAEKCAVVDDLRDLQFIHMPDVIRLWGDEAFHVDCFFFVVVVPADLDMEGFLLLGECIFRI